MNVARFELAVNHEDPEVVKRGLDEFRFCILSENNATMSFGYLGISLPLNLNQHSICTGQLKVYLDKSPQIEEIFALWSLPGQDTDKDLLVSLLQCLTVILHCSQTRKIICEEITGRILQDHSDSLRKYLNSSKMEVVHSALGLVLAMCRTSDRLCLSSYEKILQSCTAVNKLIQKGKSVDWTSSCGSCRVIGVDSRQLLIVIMTLVMKSSATSGEVWGNHVSHWRQVTHSVNKDSEGCLRLFLDGLIALVRSVPLVRRHLLDYLDSVCIQKLLSISDADDPSRADMVHDFLSTLCCMVASESLGDAQDPLAGVDLAAFPSELLGQLALHVKEKDMQIAAVLLRAFPSLLPKCLYFPGFSWEPRSTEEYVRAVSTACHLLDNDFGSADSIARLNQELSTAASSRSGGGTGTAASRGALENLVGSMMPRGLGLRELRKLLSHPNLAVQDAGFRLIASITRKLRKSLTEAGAAGSPTILAVFGEILSNHIPDAQQILLCALRLSNSGESAVDEGANIVLPAAGDDFDFNVLPPSGPAAGGDGVGAANITTAFESGDTSLTSGDRDACYLSALRAVDSCLCLQESIHSVCSADSLLRLLEEHPVWAESDSSVRAEEIIRLRLSLLAVLSLLGKLCIDESDCRYWFGGRDDAVKALGSLLVGNEDWRSSSPKETALIRLMQLCACDDVEIRSSSLRVLTAVYDASGLFEGHERVDYEMQVELRAWTDALSSREGDGSTALVAGRLTKLAYHWNAALCASAAESGASYPSRFSAANLSVPLSPVLIMACSLTTGNFDCFCNDLPAHIRRHALGVTTARSTCDQVAAAEDVRFFSKFTSLTLPSIEWLLMEVSFDVAVNCGNSSAYCDCLAHVVKSFATLPTEMVFMSELAQWHDLLQGEEMHFPGKGHARFASTLSSIAAAEAEEESVTSGARKSKRQRTTQGPETSRSEERWLSVKNATRRVFSDLVSGRHVSRTDDSSSFWSPLQLCALVALHLVESSKQTIALLSDLPRSPLNNFIQRHWAFVARLAVAAGTNMIAGPTDAVVNMAACVRWIADSWATATKEVSHTSQLSGARMSRLCMDGLLLMKQVASAAPFAGDVAAADFSERQTERPNKRKLSVRSVENYAVPVTVLCEDIVTFLRDGFSSAWSVGVDTWSLLLASGVAERCGRIDVHGVWSRSLLVAAADGRLPGHGVEKYCHSHDELWSSVVHVLSGLANKDAASTDFADLITCALRCTEAVPSNDLQTRRCELQANFARYMQPRGIISGLDESAREEIFRYGDRASIAARVRSACLELWPSSTQSWGAMAVGNLQTSFWCDPLVLVGDVRRIVAEALAQAEDPAGDFLNSHCPQILAQWADSHGHYLYNEFRCDNATVGALIHLACGHAVDQTAVRDAPRAVASLKEVASHVCSTLHRGVSEDCRRVRTAAASVLELSVEVAALNSDVHDAVCDVLGSFIRLSPAERLQWTQCSGELYLRLLKLTASALSIEPSLTDAWMSCYCVVVDYFMVSCADAASSGRLVDGMLLSRVVQLLRLPIARNILPSAQQFTKTRTSLIKLAGKWLRSCLRNAIDSGDVLEAIRALVPVWNRSSVTLRRSEDEDNRCSGDEFSCVWDLVVSGGDADSTTSQFTSSALLGMVVGHSKFEGVVRGECSRGQPLCPMLSLLVELVAVQSSESNDVDAHLSRVLLSAYSGSLSLPDRLIYRTLHHLEASGRGPTMDSARFGRAAASQSIRDDASLPSWLLNNAFLTPPAIYSSLTEFPFWREAVPRSNETEGDRMQCSQSVRDPAYYLPVILHTLRNYEVSIRLLANSGGLALLLTSLGCTCPLMRLRALACLHLVFLSLKKQTAERDPAFRERSQILLLVLHVRSSVEQFSVNGPIPQLPPSVCLFLGHASMNLMQPGHAMYGKFNKYLLSRPLCDAKDVPLFDLLVVGADAHTDTAQRLAALRLIRDGLRTPADYINLCRKNGFNRMLLLFRHFSAAADGRVSHAILDVLERAMAIDQCCRYLVERCDIVSWLQLQLMVVSEHSAPIPSKQSQTARYFVRCFDILRTLLGACYRCAKEGLSAALDMSATFFRLSESVALIAGAHADQSASVTLAYHSRLLLCMWDIAAFSADLNISNANNCLSATIVLCIAERLQGEEASGTSEEEAILRNNILLSYLCFLKFCDMRSIALGPIRSRVLHMLSLWNSVDVEIAPTDGVSKAWIKCSSVRWGTASGTSSPEALRLPSSLGPRFVMSCVVDWEQQQSFKFPELCADDLACLRLLLSVAQRHNLGGSTEELQLVLPDHLHNATNFVLRLVRGLVSKVLESPEYLHAVTFLFSVNLDGVMPHAPHLIAELHRSVWGLTSAALTVYDRCTMPNTTSNVTASADCTKKTTCGGVAVDKEGLLDRITHLQQFCKKKYEFLESVGVAVGQLLSISSSITLARSGEWMDACVDHFDASRHQSASDPHNAATTGLANESENGCEDDKEFVGGDDDSVGDSIPSNISSSFSDNSDSDIDDEDDEEVGDIRRCDDQ